jgi:ribonuclease HI
MAQPPDTAQPRDKAQPPPTDEELLRFIAQEEPLAATLAAFPGVTRERLQRLLAPALPGQPASGQTAPSRPAAAARSTAATRPPAAEPAAAAAPAPARHRVLRVYSDGAARGNPGPAGAGAVLADTEGRVVERLGRYLGVQTNNVAEYTGLLLGLARARELGAEAVEVYADSELMIRQLEGRYQVKAPGLKPLFEQARGLLRGFRGGVRLTHVPRAQNAEADAMSNRAIDERL